MQQPAMQMPIVKRKRRLATGSGTILAVIAAIIILIVGLVTNFHISLGYGIDNTVLTWAMLFALFGTPLLAGLIGMLRSGYIGTAVLSGLWEGFLVSLFLSILILVLSSISGSGGFFNAAIREGQGQLAQQGINVAAATHSSLLGKLATLAFLIIFWLGVGAILGLIGGLIGKIFVHHPRDIIIMPPKPTMDAPHA